MWHQTPIFNWATAGTRRWMGQGSAGALPASGFRHCLGDKKKPWPGWDFGQQEGFRSGRARVTMGWAVWTGARLGHQLSWGHVQGYSGAGVVSSGLSGQALTPPGAAMPSCTVARGVPGAGRGICFQTDSQVLRLKQNNQKPGFPRSFKITGNKILYKQQLKLSKI